MVSIKVVVYLQQNGFRKIRPTEKKHQGRNYFALFFYAGSSLMQSGKSWWMTLRTLSDLSLRWAKLSYSVYCYHCTRNEVFHDGFLQLMWPNPLETADLVTFTVEILNGKLHCLCSDKSKTPSYLKEIIHPLDIWIQVLRECSYWASRNGAVQKIFLTLTKNLFLAELQEFIFHNVEWIEVRTTSEVFWAELFCKISDISC